MLGEAHDFFRYAHDLIKSTLLVDRVSLLLLEADQQQFWTLLASSTLQGEEWITVKMPIDAGPAGKVLVTQRPLYIPFDAADDPKWGEGFRDLERKVGYRIYTAATFPLFSRTGVFRGCVNLLNKLRAIPNNYGLTDICLDLDGIMADQGDQKIVSPNLAQDNDIPFLANGMDISRIDFNGFTAMDETIWQSLTPLLTQKFEAVFGETQEDR